MEQNKIELNMSISDAMKVRIAEKLTEVKRTDDDELDANVKASMPVENPVDEFDKKVSEWMFESATKSKSKYLIIKTVEKKIKKFGMAFKTSVSFVPELSNKKVFRTGKERTINLIRVRGAIIRHGIKNGAELLEYYKNKGKREME